MRQASTHSLCGKSVVWVRRRGGSLCQGTRRTHLRSNISKTFCPKVHPSGCVASFPSSSLLRCRVWVPLHALACLRGPPPSLRPPRSQGKGVRKGREREPPRRTGTLTCDQRGKQWGPKHLTLSDKTLLKKSDLALSWAFPCSSRRTSWRAWFSVGEEAFSELQ